MSAGVAVSAREHRPCAPAHRPQLRLVRTRPSRRPWAAAATLAALAGALAGLIVLTTASSQAAFRLGTLQRAGQQLDLREQQLRTAVQRAEAPGALERRARRLGMRPAATVRWLRTAAAPSTTRP